MTQPRGYHGRFGPQPLAVRFAQKFVRGGDADCWLWTGAISAHKRKRNHRQGHIIADDGSTLISSRAAWLIFKGEIPAGSHVLHTCDNPICVNPHHLFLGTNTDNIADRMAKGRSTIGEKDGFAKLTTEQVIAISSAVGPVAQIARQYGIGRTQVYRIRRKETWAHLWVRAVDEQEVTDATE
jgi:hypothetical protein